jgi:hypothetical protein
LRRAGIPLALLALVFLVVATVLETIGPFAPRPEIAYGQLLDDVGAGRIQRVVWWRDRAEVTRGDEMLALRLPADADFPAELYAAAAASQTGMSWSELPDLWVWMMTPVVPALLAVLAALILLQAHLRRPRARSSAPGTGS